MVDFTKLGLENLFKCYRHQAYYLLQEEVEEVICDRITANARRDIDDEDIPAYIELHGRTRDEIEFYIEIYMDMFIKRYTRKEIIFITGIGRHSPGKNSQIRIYAKKILEYYKEINPEIEIYYNNGRFYVYY